MVKNKTLNDWDKKFDSNIDELPDELIKYLKDICKKLFIHNQLDNDKQINNDCGRFLVYYSKDDNFFSILYGLRYNNRNILFV